MKNDSSAKPSSALVVADKKAHWPGGCVGIFFKLFDWNRRFGQKKLLPKKLIAPTRVNQVSKKFNADEKLPMPKHMMIADGKGGVYADMSKNVKEGDVQKVLTSRSSSVRIEQRHDTKSPSLVARLMGLESMPLVESKSPDKSCNSGNYDQMNGRFVGGFESDKERWNLEKVCLRHEHRLQKIQKTGVSDRRPVSRFGADALQIRNVLSRSRKRHPKLASPLKSPRGSRNSSRLMDAAAKILEPGLQARSRVKCSLTYSNGIGEEQMMIDLSAQSSYEVRNPQGFKVQSSCQNCGHSVESTDLKLDVINEKESQVVLLRSGYRSPNVENQWLFSKNSPFHHERNVSPPVALKQRARVLSKPQTQMVNSGDRVPPRSRRVSSTCNQTKDFIALNRNLSQSCVRFPRKPSNITEVGRHYSVPKNDGLSTQRNVVRRRTAASSCKQVESASSSRLTMDRHRSIKSRVVIENKDSVNANSADQTCVERRSGAEGGSGQSKDIDVVSFSFSSPLRSKSSSFSPTQVDNKGSESSNSSQMKEDAIGALLEQKLKELTDQAEYESRTGIVPQGRTTALILQELISALTVERPISPDTNLNLSSRPAMHKTSQGKAMRKHSSMRFSGDRLSPGLVLDASFSNDSCVSSSRDDISGHIFQCDDMDISYDEPQSVHSDADLTDSASSMITKENNSHTIVTVTHLLDPISDLLQRANLSNTRPYAGHINEVLLNAEMLLGNAGPPARFVGFLVGPFLDELEILAAAVWRNTVILGFQVSKGDNQIPLRTFLFDCLAECLDLRFARYGASGFRDWCKLLPTQNTTEALLQLFDYEVRKWASLAMMSTDEVIHWEMSTSLGKWTDFNVEAFESAAELGQGIFQSLIDEVVAEFL